MTLNFKNQNDILNLEMLNSNEIEYIFSDKPINRLKTKPQLEDKIKLLSELRSEIENISNILHKIQQYFEKARIKYFQYSLDVLENLIVSNIFNSYSC